MSKQVAWADKPPAYKAAASRIVRVDGQSVQDWVIVSNAVVGVWTHYIDDRRTFPCCGDHDTCPFDHQRTSRRWQGWLAVQKPLGKVAWYVCLTQSAVANCPVLIDGAGSLRGLELRLKRAIDGNKNSRLMASTGVNMWETTRLLQAPDVTLFLQTLWGPPETWPVKWPEGKPVPPLQLSDSVELNGVVSQVYAEIGRMP